MFQCGRIVFETELDVVTEHPMIISDTHFAASHSESTLGRIRIFLKKFCLTHGLILQPLLGKQLNILAPLCIAIINITMFQTPVHIFICNHLQAICIPQPIIMGSNQRISIVDSGSIVLLPCQSHILLIERYEIFLTFFF